MDNALAAFPERGQEAVEQLTLRAGEVVMSPARAAAAYPSALSFARAAVRRLARQRFVLERLRIAIDREGKGEFLYRFSNGTWTFHFFVLSDSFPAEMKIDRNFGTNWDAMAILCQGEWTAEREEHMRREMPKARAGVTDYDSLIYARGNRSGRLFDQVVEALAQGRQPDGAQLAQVGYILRTTAFIGNGAMGTRPWAGFEPDHPLRQPYHAQMCGAFLLREYVCDLVDHMARARNPALAVTLSLPYRRYLGIGNSAATGLVPFVTQRPLVIHQWCFSSESASAQARQRCITPESEQWMAFQALIRKAAAYFEQDGRDGNGIFAASQRIANELLRSEQEAKDMVSRQGSKGGAAPFNVWNPLLRWASENTHPETTELVQSIILELYPDIVEAFSDRFQAAEHMDVKPAMTVLELKDLLQAHYDWALSIDIKAEHASHYFWYRGKAAPLDMRRGVRGLIGRDEFEMGTDTVFKIHQLRAYIDTLPLDIPVAEALLSRPDLRYIVARVQTLAECEFAELRVNYADKSYTPYAPIRLVLSFYGMEKLSAAPPKSVRGALLQGAPTAQDLVSGKEGDWPFPLVPMAGNGAIAGSAAPDAPFDEAGMTDLRSMPAVPENEFSFTVSPSELARFSQKALQGNGASLGASNEGAHAVVFAQILWDSGLVPLISQLENQGLAKPDVLLRNDAFHAVLAARGRSALLLAQEALDLACAKASSNSLGVGIVWVKDATGLSLLDGIALQAAQRGMVGLLLWVAGEGGKPEPLGAARVTVAGPGGSSPWFMGAELPRSPQLCSRLVDSLDIGGGTAEAIATTAFTRHGKLAMPESLFLPAVRPASNKGRTGFLMICLRPECVVGKGKDLYAAVRKIYAAASVEKNSAAYGEEQLQEKLGSAFRHGLQVDRRDWYQLTGLATELLIDPVDEVLLRPDGLDPQLFL